MQKLLSAITMAAVFVSGAAFAAEPQRAAAPIAGAAQVVKGSATIKAIDATEREIVLVGADGREHVVRAGPEVANFPQLRVGDRVDVEYVAAVVVELRKGGSGIVSRVERASAAKARPGDKPAASAGREVIVTASVVAIDAGSRSVTLKGPKQTVRVVVRDAEALKRLRIGDEVEATYAESVALSVSAAR